MIPLSKLAVVKEASLAKGMCVCDVPKRKNDYRCLMNKCY